MSASTDTTTYNGWSNYPTWAVNLWLSNDEAVYNETLSYAQRVHDDGNKEQSDSYRRSELLKSWVRDDLAPHLGASFAADLLGYAIDQVNWREIADAWLEDPLVKRNTGFYVTIKATGQRVFLEKQWKWDRWYYTADGWTTQATGKLDAIRASGLSVRV